MAGWDGSGNFVRGDGTRTGTQVWQDARDAGVKIRADDHDTHDEVLATGISECLTKNNETKPTSSFQPNSDGSYDLGGASLAWRDLYLSGQVKTLMSWSKGADVASASALTLGTDGNYFDITGTTAITSIGTLGVGTVVKLHFDDALTLTHHATNLILPGGANITTAAGDEAEFVEYATGDWRCTNYTKASGAPQTVYDDGAIKGLTLSNNGTDSAHDIDIATGFATAEGGDFVLNLTSGLTKQIDATWAAGTNAGGDFVTSGSPTADTWYHVFLIRKDSDGSIDAGFDTSVSAANIPSGYTAYRWLGAVLTDGSSNIIQFIQFENTFYWNDQQANVANQVSSATAYNQGVTVPTGLKVEAILTIYAENNSGTEYTMVYDPDAGARTPTLAGAKISTSASAYRNNNEFRVLTNTSAQVAIDSNGAGQQLWLNTVGWVAPR